MEQLVAIHSLHYLTQAGSDGCRLDLFTPDGLKPRPEGIEGECRPGLVAVQGALASAPDRNWTNLALFITRTPPFGEGVDRFPREARSRTDGRVRDL
jgi:hypothetical protein